MSDIDRGRPVFKLRKEVTSLVDNTNNSIIIDETKNNNSDESIDLTFSNSKATVVDHIVEPNLLTENEKYSVESVKLDLLALLGEESKLVGFIDSFSGKAMINDNEHLYIWNYHEWKQSAYNKLPLNLTDGQDDIPPICLLTWPATMDTLDTDTSCWGICIIYRQSGKIFFYEDLSSINNLYSQLSQNMAHVLDLKLSNSNEFITSAISVEPSGIVLATSFGRVLFITIRDSMGHPRIQLKQQLIKSQRSFFSSLFGSRDDESTNVNNNKKRYQSHDVVSLKNGPIIGKGDRLLYITTRRGEFHIWQLSVSSNCFKRIETNIYNQILESLQDLYPFAASSLQILDSHPISHNNNKNNDNYLTHVVLSSISNYPDDVYYILSTLVFDEEANNFNIISTYRINTYMSPLNKLSSVTFPKLIIPNWSNELLEKSITKTSKISNVVVLFHNAMVLTQVSSQFDVSFTLKRKWEDVISFKDSVNIFGTGCTSHKIYLLSKGLGGIISVTLKDNLSLETTPEEVRFIKSHIEQAIYFFDKDTQMEIMNPVEFNLSKDIALDTKSIENDLKLSALEIIQSTSKYIPKFTSNLQQHLSTRINYFKNLLRFTELNFNDNISVTFKLWLIENFEIMNSCLRLYQFLNGSDKSLQTVWDNVLKQNNVSVEELIISKILQYPKVFNDFLHNIVTNSQSIEFKSKIIEMINSCLYEAVLEEGENDIRYGTMKLNAKQVNPASLPWFITLSNLTKINGLFFEYKFQFKNENVEINSNDIKEQFLTLLKILYYCFNQVRLWTNQSGIITVDEIKSKDIISINKLYTDNHIDWNNILCEFGYQSQSIEITEFYKDLESLVQTLETLPVDQSDVVDLYNKFFQKFQMLFSATLFEYYASNHKLSELFYRFPEQHDNLIKFFQDNSPKYGSISWIQDIIDQRYSDASKTLFDLPLLHQDITENQFHLNVAKLACLVEQEDDNGQQDKKQFEIRKLQQIQCSLDLLDAEIEFINRIKQDQIKLSPRFIDTPIESFFNKLKSLLMDNVTISFNETIEMYSILADSENIYCALKLLSFNVDLIEFEIRQYLVSMIWRRCILLDLDRNIRNNDIKDTVLYKILEKFFAERLYEHDYPLPHISMLTDKFLISDDLLRNLYGKYLNDDITSIRQIITQETETISQQMSEINLQDVIAAANLSTGNHCVINYITNEIDYTK